MSIFVHGIASFIQLWQLKSVHTSTFLTLKQQISTWNILELQALVRYYRYQHFSAGTVGINYGRMWTYGKLTPTFSSGPKNACLSAKCWLLYQFVKDIPLFVKIPKQFTDW